MNYVFKAQSFSNQVLNLLRHLAEKSKFCWTVNRSVCTPWRSPQSPINVNGGGWGVNRGMQMRRSVPFFAKSIDPPKFLFNSETTTTSGSGSVKVNGGNFAQIVVKATCLMTITQCDSNNSLTSEFK